MATFITRIRPQGTTNFNASAEINFWAKKYDVTPLEFKKVFQSCNNSISATIVEFNKLRA